MGSDLVFSLCAHSIDKCLLHSLLAIIWQCTRQMKIGVAIATIFNVLAKRDCVRRWLITSNECTRAVGKHHVPLNQRSLAWFRIVWFFYDRCLGLALRECDDAAAAFLQPIKFMRSIESSIRRSFVGMGFNGSIAIPYIQISRSFIRYESGSMRMCK